MMLPEGSERAPGQLMPAAIRRRELYVGMQVAMLIHRRRSGNVVQFLRKTGTGRSLRQGAFARAQVSRR